MRRMVSTLLLCALLVSTASSASCNQQGDLARLLDVLEGSHEYDDYSYYASGFDKIWANYVGAVVSSLDASELLLLRRNWVGDYEQVGRYPRAVYQPEDGNVPCWELHWIEDDGFSLSLLRDGVPAESYVFAWDGFDRVHRQPQLVLREAQMNGLNFRFRDERGRYTVTDATDSASWQVDAIPLERFCMDLMPRSLEAVKRSNVLHAVLADELNDEVQERVNFGRSETLPVYTAPSEDAYRDDEAAVSLEAPFTVRNALDGDIWWMIDYAISGTSGRIGYVKRPKDGHVKRGTFSTTPIAVTLGQNAALTDDPYGSCRELTRLPAGAQVISLGWLDAFYACVETQIEGKTARGYLPLHALELPNETPQTDVMAELTGTWRFISGGQFLGLGGVIFKPDGHFTLCGVDDEEICPPETLIPDDATYAYALYPVDAPAGSYGGSEQYKIMLFYDEGFVERYHLYYRRADGTPQSRDTLLLTYGVAGGTYERYEP